MIDALMISPALTQAGAAADAFDVLMAGGLLALITLAVIVDLAGLLGWAVRWWR
jgi:hypothetical protein